jgi:hypothetical protein
MELNPQRQAVVGAATPPPSAEHIRILLLEEAAALAVSGEWAAVAVAAEGRKERQTRDTLAALVASATADWAGLGLAQA